MHSQSAVQLHQQRCDATDDGHVLQTQAYQTFSLVLYNLYPKKSTIKLELNICSLEDVFYVTVEIKLV